jgi:hypothetical protein
MLPATHLVRASQTHSEAVIVKQRSAVCTLLYMHLHIQLHEDFVAKYAYAVLLLQALRLLFDSRTRTTLQASKSFKADTSA